MQHPYRPRLRYSDGEQPIPFLNASEKTKAFEYPTASATDSTFASVVASKCAAWSNRNWMT